MELRSDPRRVLLLGGSGLLGSALAPALRAAGVEVVAPRHAELDLRDLDALRARARDARPELIINSAAQAHVDEAERDPDTAFAINAAGAQNAALAALEADVPLLHVSTDYVFDGSRREPYCEHHPTGTPPNLYGQSKLAGELLVRALCPRHYIVRVAALFGPGRAGFVDWVLEKADPTAPLRIVADRFASPTWTVDLAAQLLVLLRTPCYGTYHAAGGGPTSWYELARTALLLAGRDPAGIVAIADYQLAAPARRAPFTALANHLLRIRGLDRMMTWRDGLARFIESRRAAQGGEP